MEVSHLAPQGMCLPLGFLTAKLVQLGAEDVVHEVKTLCGRDCSERVWHSHEHLRQQPLLASRAVDQLVLKLQKCQLAKENSASLHLSRHTEMQLLAETFSLNRNLATPERNHDHATTGKSSLPLMLLMTLNWSETTLFTRPLVNLFHILQRAMCLAHHIIHQHSRSPTTATNLKTNDLGKACP